MSYLQLIAPTTMVQVRQGMDDVPEMQYIDIMPASEAVKIAEEFNQGHCDDRWAVFGLDDIVLDELCGGEGGYEVVGFALSYDKDPTPRRFSILSDEAWNRKQDELAWGKENPDIPF